MKKLLMAFALVATSFGLQAQTKQPGAVVNRNFYVELGGPGQLFSASYDGRFSASSRLGWGFRVGLGFTVVDDVTVTTITQPNPGGQPFTYQNYDYKTKSIGTLPLGVNYLFGKPNNPNIFEVGAGVTVLTREASIYQYDEDVTKKGRFLGHASFMYRRQPVDGGVSWRIGITPIIGTTGDVFPMGAVGLGYAF